MGNIPVTTYLDAIPPRFFAIENAASTDHQLVIIDLRDEAEIGTKVMNDPVLRKKYLDPEHKGVKVLMLLTHQPGNINTAKKAVRRLEDIKGLRLRFASATIRDFITALGGTPVGMPPTRITESMQKGTIDGAVMVATANGRFEWWFGGVPPIELEVEGRSVIESVVEAVP